MSAVLETSDRHVDRVSVIVDPFWKAFVFGTFSSEQFYRHRELSVGFTGGGGGCSTFGKLEGCGGYTGTVFGFVMFF